MQNNCARRSDLDRNCRFLAHRPCKPFNRYLERECHMKTRSATSNARRTLLRRGRDLLRSVSKGRGRGKGADVMDLLDEGQRDELGLIHLALERIERGIFGMCEQCYERISEERLRAVAEHVPGVVYSYDITPEGRRHLNFLGPGLEDLIGADSAARVRTEFDNPPLPLIPYGIRPER